MNTLTLLSVISIFFTFFASCTKNNNSEENKNMSTPERNKELVRYFLDEVYNKGNYSVADSVIADDYTSHNKLSIEVLGPEGIKKNRFGTEEYFS